MKKISIFFLLAFVFLFGASQADAVKLHAIEALSIKEANFNYSPKDNSANGIVKVQNPSRESKNFRIYISFVSPDSGKELLRLPVTDPSTVKSLSLAKKTFSLKSLPLPKGDYEVIILLESVGLGISSVKNLGLLKIKNSQELPFKYSLICKADNASAKEGYIPVACSVNPALAAEDEVSISYSLKPVGSAKIFSRDSFSLPKMSGSNLRFSLPAKNLPGGTTDVSVQLFSKDAKSNVSYLRYYMPGKYSRIVYMKNINAERKISLYLNGSLYLENRRLLVGKLDFDKICFYQDIDLYSIAPLNREISYRNNNNCGAQAKNFAIIYKMPVGGIENIKADDILDYKGLNDRASALSILRTVFQKEYSLFEKIKNTLWLDGVLPAILAFVALLGLLIFGLVFAKRKGYIAIIAFALLFAPSAFSNAEVFDSLDAPKVRFEVNFPNITKEVGQNDDIVFSFAAIDNFAGAVNKYPGTEVYAWIDNASTSKVQIMSASDNDAVVAVSMANNLSLGVHTLNFEVPASTGICGAAYDFTNFDEGVFDPLPCEFSVDFTVVPGSKISLIFYAQPKAVEQGQASNLYWASSGADSCTASDGWSGNKALINMAGESTGPINTSYQDFTLTCQNATENVSQTDTVYTYICGDGYCSQWEDCNLCALDCGSCAGAQSVSITAEPQLIREGGVSYITWHSNGYTNCVVDEDNASINDHWVRLAGVEKTSPLNGDTVYTVTCDNNGADQVSKSVKVRIVPKYIEF